MKKLIGLPLPFKICFMLLTSLGMWLQDGRISSYRDFHCKTGHCIFTHFHREMFVAAYLVIQMVPIFYCVWTIFSKPPLFKQGMIFAIRHLRGLNSIFRSLQPISSPPDFKHGLFCKDHANRGLQQAFAVHSYCRLLSFGLLKKSPRIIPQKLLFAINIFLTN